MEKSDSVFGKILKAVLVLVGGVLVLGGGVCTSTNLFFTAINPGLIGITGILLAICVAAIWAGWAILKATGVFQSGKQPTDANGK